MKYMMKKLLFIFSALSILLCSACTGDQSVKLTNIEDYTKYIQWVTNSSDFMPDLVLLESSESVKVFYFNLRNPLTDTKTINLIVTYDEVEYVDAKETILSNYTFLEQPAMKYDYYTIPVVEFEYNEFTIKVVEDESFIYPKWFGMIGYSDTKKQICYMYIHDIERDEISNTPNRMEEFTNKYFKFD